MVCAGHRRSETTEINELESGDTPRVSGHPKPTTSDGDAASRSWRLFEKSRLATKIFRGNPWFGPKSVSGCENP